MKKFTFLASFLALILISFTTSAQTVLFEENFDDGNASERWTIGEVGTNNLSDLAFDYTSGIAAAPNGGGKGLKLTVNSAEPAVGSNQIFAFIKDKTFTGTYILEFDVWCNFVENPGSTETLLLALDRTATTLPAADGIEYNLYTDGSSAASFRIYQNGARIKDAAGGFVNETSQNFEDEPYLSTFTDEPYNEWISISIEITETTAIFKVNDILWSTTTLTTNDGIIGLGLWDYYSSVAPLTTFALYDNIKVTQSDATGINNSKFETFSVYPNPANDILNVVVSKRSNFELINTVGQTVMSRMVEGKTTIELGSINEGLYFAKVTNKNGDIQTRKVIIK